MKSSKYINKKYTNEIKKTPKKHDSEFAYINAKFAEINTILKQMMVQNHNDFPDKMDSLQVQDPDTVCWKCG